MIAVTITIGIVVVCAFIIVCALMLHEFIESRRESTEVDRYWADLEDPADVLTERYEQIHKQEEYITNYGRRMKGDHR